MPINCTVFAGPFACGKDNTIAEINKHQFFKFKSQREDMSMPC